MTICATCGNDYAPAFEVAPRRLRLRAPQPIVSKVLELTSLTDCPNIELV